jgi:hypothetical protein
VQQVKQLTSMSRVLAPAVYVFSKRIENVIVQKERELRRDTTPGQAGQSVGSGSGSLVIDRGDFDTSSVIDGASSIVSELDSNCGTQYADTVVTQETPKNRGDSDVGNVQDINECLNLKSEDERRRWFYSQCLSAKLACSDEARVKKLLISDLYTRVQAENVPVENWVSWIKQQLSPEGSSGGSGGTNPPSVAATPTAAPSGTMQSSLAASSSMSGLSTSASGNQLEQTLGQTQMVSRVMAGKQPASPRPSLKGLGAAAYPQSKDLTGLQQLPAPPGGRGTFGGLAHSQAGRPNFGGLAGFSASLSAAGANGLTGSSQAQQSPGPSPAPAHTPPKPWYA